MTRRFFIVLLSVFSVLNIQAEDLRYQNGGAPLFTSKPDYVNLLEAQDRKLYLFALASGKLRVYVSSDRGKSFSEQSFDSRGLELEEVREPQLHYYFSQSWILSFTAKVGGREALYALAPNKAGLGLISSLALNQNPVGQEKLLFVKTLPYSLGEFLSFSLTKTQSLASLWAVRGGLLFQETWDIGRSFEVEGAEVLGIEQGKTSKILLVSWGRGSGADLKLGLELFEGIRRVGSWEGELEGFEPGEDPIIAVHKPGTGSFALEFRQKGRLAYLEWEEESLNIRKSQKLEGLGGNVFFQGPGKPLLSLELEGLKLGWQYQERAFETSRLEGTAPLDDLLAIGTETFSLLEKSFSWTPSGACLWGYSQGDNQVHVQQLNFDTGNASFWQRSGEGRLEGTLGEHGFFRDRGQFFGLFETSKDRETIFTWVRVEKGQWNPEELPPSRNPSFYQLYQRGGMYYLVLGPRQQPKEGQLWPLGPGLGFGD